MSIRQARIIKPISLRDCYVMCAREHVFVPACKAVLHPALYTCGDVSVHATPAQAAKQRTEQRRAVGGSLQVWQRPAWPLPAAGPASPQTACGMPFAAFASGCLTRRRLVKQQRQVTGMHGDLQGTIKSTSHATPMCQAFQRLAAHRPSMHVAKPSTEHQQLSGLSPMHSQAPGPVLQAQQPAKSCV